MKKETFIKLLESIANIHADVDKLNTLKIDIAESNIVTTFEEVCTDPHNAKIPSENISAMFALSGSIAAQVTKETMDKVVPFMERMPKEYQLRTFTDFTKRKPTLVTHPDLRKWLQTNSPEMMKA